MMQTIRLLVVGALTALAGSIYPAAAQTHTFLCLLGSARAQVQVRKDLDGAALEAEVARKCAERPAPAVQPPTQGPSRGFRPDPSYQLPQGPGVDYPPPKPPRRHYWDPAPSKPNYWDDRRATGFQTPPVSVPSPYSPGQVVKPVPGKTAHLEFQVVDDSPAVRALIGSYGHREKDYTIPLFRASRQPGSGVVAHTGGGHIVVSTQFGNAQVAELFYALTSGDRYVGVVQPRRTTINSLEVTIPLFSSGQGGLGTAILVAPLSVFKDHNGRWAGTLVCYRAVGFQIVPTAPVTHGKYAGQKDVQCDGYAGPADEPHAARYFREHNGGAVMFTFIRHTSFTDTVGIAFYARGG